MTRSLAFSIILSCLSMAAAAQDLNLPPVSYPALPESAADASGFVPEGWRLEFEARGDLDRDGTDDLLFVVRQDDPANVIVHGGLGESPFDSNPRILAAALAGTGQGFRLALENRTLIARRDDPVRSDPLSEMGGIAIDRGSIVVNLYFFMSAGGADMGTRSFRLRLQDGDFRLIGFDESIVQRMSGDTRTISINYLTGKAVITTGNIESDAVETETRRLKKVPLLAADDIGDGLMFLHGL